MKKDYSKKFDEFIESIDDIVSDEVNDSSALIVTKINDDRLVYMVGRRIDLMAVLIYNALENENLRNVILDCAEILKDEKLYENIESLKAEHLKRS